MTAGETTVGAVVVDWCRNTLAISASIPTAPPTMPMTVYLTSRTIMTIRTMKPIEIPPYP